VEPLICGALYWPAEVGPYLWDEFDAGRIGADLAAVRAAGFSVVRLPLAWDAFMPSPRQVSRRRLRELETVLDAAAAVSLAVVPVLFAQSWGDCVWLPRYAVDRRRPRPGVRVISDGNVVPGGPRDLYADPLMLELATTWVDALLRAFAGHPGVAAWDLGHDPATTVRPRRIAHLGAWVELLAGRIRGQQERCWLTLGAGDVLVARGVRLAAVAPHLDAVGLATAPQPPALPLSDTSAGDVAFLLQLAERLCDQAAPVVLLNTGVAAEDPEAPADGDTGAAAETALAPADAVRVTAAVLERAVAGGAAGLMAVSWCDTGPRTLEAPPFDRAPWLARCGLTAPGGALKPHGAEWSRLARREPAVAATDPWPPHLDVEEYYANLPDSARDLRSRWDAERGGD
jgi:hypothetical protein